MSLRRDVVVSETYQCDSCDKTSQSTWDWWTLVSPEHANVSDFCSAACLSQWVNQ